MDASASSETLVALFKTAWYHIPEDFILNILACVLNVRIVKQAETAVARQLRILAE
jgi:hypothetical protein